MTLLAVANDTLLVHYTFGIVFACPYLTMLGAKSIKILGVATVAASSPKIHS
jgi:hypothetical protein